MTNKVQKIIEDVERLCNAGLHNSTISKKDVLNTILAVVNNFKEEPVSEDLEEVCEQLAENARKHKAETISPFFSPTDYKQGVIDGANWKEQQMMAKAIDGRVSVNVESNYHRLIYGCWDIDDALKNYGDGDKLKIIVIKND